MQEIAEVVSGEGEKLGLELLLGGSGTNDLVLDFAIFEEEQERDGADIVFDGEIAGFIDVDLADFCLSGDFLAKLIDDGADHFAGATPFGPEIDQNGDIGIEDFGLEIAVVECECHGGSLLGNRGASRVGLKTCGQKSGCFGISHSQSLTRRLGSRS